MVNVWIIYNTKHGNCKKVAEEVGEKLSNKYDVKIKQITEIKPEDLANEKPDILIVGARIVVGSPDRKIKKFLSRLGKLLESPISKAATLYTHVLKWDASFAKLPKILKENNIAENICTDFLGIKMAKMKGPAESGQDNKIKVFIEKVSEFISK